DFNCYDLGSEVGVAFRNTATGLFEKDPDLKLSIQSVTVRDKATVKEDPFLSTYLADDMGFSFADFQSYLDGFKRDQVNVTRFQIITGGK
ncbi:MAG: hypothetical protein AAF203_07805, partial [Pseudomonadota bacterium]